MADPIIIPSLEIGLLHSIHHTGSKLRARLGSIAIRSSLAPVNRSFAIPGECLLREHVQLVGRIGSQTQFRGLYGLVSQPERVVLPPVRAQIFHPYSDAPEEGIEVLAYEYTESLT